MWCVDLDFVYDETHISRIGTRQMNMKFMRSARDTCVCDGQMNLVDYGNNVLFILLENSNALT